MASTALARSCLNFQSAERSQANLDIFRGKGMSRPPFSAHCVAAFYCVPIAFGVLVCDSLCSYDAFAALSRRSQCVYCSFTRRLHCADGVLKTQCSDFPTFRSFGQGRVEFWKIAFVHSKFGYIHSVLNEQDLHAKCKALHYTKM